MSCASVSVISDRLTMRASIATLLFLMAAFAQGSVVYEFILQIAPAGQQSYCQQPASKRQKITKPGNWLASRRLHTFPRAENYHIRDCEHADGHALTLSLTFSTILAIGLNAVRKPHWQDICFDNTA